MHVHWEALSHNPQLPAKMNSPIQRQDLSFRMGTTWDSTNIDCEGELMLVDPTSNVMQNPQRITSANDSFHQSTPHLDEEAQTTRFHISNSQANWLWPATEEPAIHGHKSLGKASQGYKTALVSSIEGQPKPDELSDYIDHPYPHLSNHSTLTFPTVSSRSDANMKKRLASPIVDTSRKRHHFSELTSLQKTAGQGEVKMPITYFNSSPSSTSARSVSSEDLPVHSHSKNGDPAAEHEEYARGVASDNPVKRMQDVERKKLFSNRQKLPKSTPTISTSAENFEDMVSGVVLKSYSSDNRLASTISRSSTFGPKPIESPSGTYKLRQAPIITSSALDLMDWDTHDDDSNPRTHFFGSQSAKAKPCSPLEHRTLRAQSAGIDLNRNFAQIYEQNMHSSDKRSPKLNACKRAQYATPERSSRNFARTANVGSFAKQIMGGNQHISPKTLDRARSNQKILNSTAIRKAIANIHTIEKKKQLDHLQEVTLPQFENSGRSQSRSPQDKGHRPMPSSEPKFLFAKYTRCQTPTFQRAASLAPRTPQNGQEKAAAHEANDIDGDQTPLVDMMRKQRIAAARKKASVVGGRSPSNHFKHESSYIRTPRVRMGTDNYFESKDAKSRQPLGIPKCQESARQSKTVRRSKHFENGEADLFPKTPLRLLQKTSEIIDLSTPETKPPKSSVPIKDRMTPATKFVPKKENVNTVYPRIKKSQFVVNLISPEPPTKSKVNKPPIQQGAEFARQKQAAAQIIHKEIDTQRVELDNTLFGDADAESEKDKAQRLETEKVKQQAKDDLLLQRLVREEDTRRAAILKRKIQADEALARRESEARSLEEKRLRREAERRREEKDRELALEEKRKMAIAKIQADRDAAQRESTEKERLRIEAVTKAAEVKAKAEDLVILKTRQEEARRQAQSLTAKKVQNIQKLQVESISVSAAVSSPAQNGFTEDVAMHDIEDDEDSLFVSEKPRRDEISVAVKPLASNNTATTAIQTTNQATLAQLRLETQAQRDEISRRTKAAFETRLNRRAVEAANQSGVHQKAPSQQKPDLREIAKNLALITKPAPKVNQRLDVAEDEEEFAWSHREPLSSKVGKTLSTVVSSASSEPIERVAHGEDVLFSWSSVGSPNAEPRLDEQAQEASQSASSLISQSSASTMNHTRRFPATTTVLSDSLSTPRNDKEPQPSSPAFLANLRQLSQRRKQHLQDEKLKNKRRSARYCLTDQQRANNLAKAVEKRTRQAAEKKREQIIADAKKNGIEIRGEAIRAQVEVFMDKRAKELQKRADRRAQKFDENTQTPKERISAPRESSSHIPASRRSEGRNDSAILSEEAVREKTRSDAARKAKQTAIARERGNIGFLIAAQKTRVAHFETDSESDEDEDDDDGLAAALRKAFREHDQIDKEDGDGDGARAGWEEESETSEFGSESDSDNPDARYACESFVHNLRIIEPVPLPLADVTTSALNEDKPQHNHTSLLPRNILDTSAIKSANMLSPIVSRSKEIVLVNIYRVMQSRTKGVEIVPATLIDNYGLLSHAQDRIHFEVGKFRNSGIQIDSSFIGKDEHGRERAKIVHSEKKGSSTEFFIEVETRMADTLSGYDPDLFTSVLGKKIWNVVQCLLMKNVPSKSVGKQSAMHGNNASNAGIEVIEIDDSDNDEEDTDSFNPNQCNKEVVEAGRGAAESGEVDLEVTDSLFDEDEAPEVVTTNLVGQDQCSRSPSPYCPPPQPIYSIIYSTTCLEMANNEACEAVIRLTKPKGFKIDEHQDHSVAARDLRADTVTLNEEQRTFSVDLTAEENVQWAEWAGLKIEVVERELVGPLNV